MAEQTIEELAMELQMVFSFPRQIFDVDGLYLLHEYPKEIKYGCVLEKVTGKNDKLTPLQLLFINCHSEFSIFLPKPHLKVELTLDTKIA